MNTVKSNWKPWHKWTMSIIGGVILLLVLIAIFAPEPTVPIVYDVRKLLGKNIEEVKKELPGWDTGYQATDVQIKLDLDITSSITKKLPDGHTITVEYLDQTGAVKSVSIEAPKELPVSEYDNFIKSVKADSVDIKQFSVNKYPPKNDTAFAGIEIKANR